MFITHHIQQIFLARIIPPNASATLYRSKINNENQTKNRKHLHRKKPKWVINKVIYLKARNPDHGCRTIAHTFNRLYAHQRNTTVSKSWIYSTLLKHRYETEVLKRKLKHRHPKPVPRNTCWGMDFTTVTTQDKVRNTIFAIVDYGTRKCLCLAHTETKTSLAVIVMLVTTIVKYGKPKRIKTDNEVMFTSLTMKFFCLAVGITHQRSDIACPWQNGRLERFIGTFKRKCNRLTIANSQTLKHLLADFTLWYNRIHPHDNLGGLTPDEDWNEQNPFRHGYRQARYFSGWNGVLTGYLIE